MSGQLDINLDYINRVEPTAVNVQLHVIASAMNTNLNGAIFSTPVADKDDTNAIGRGTTPLNRRCSNFLCP
jgi:hypothetical protein